MRNCKQNMASAMALAIGLLAASQVVAQTHPPETEPTQNPVSASPAANQPATDPLASAREAQVTAQQTRSETSTPIQDDAGNEIVVTGIRAALENAAQKKRNAGNIKDAITAEDIGKFPDENVTDSLARITGVQITRDIGEGASFTIRGISQNRVEVNGRTTIGRGEDRNANIGDISSDLLGGLEVIKSPTADLIEGSLGGTVNLITRKAFDFSKPTISLSARQGYTTNADAFQPDLNLLATTRFQTGIGEIGILANASYAITKVSEDRANLNGWNAACDFDLNRNGLVNTALPIDTNADGVRDTCVADPGDLAFRPTNTALVDTNSERHRKGGVLSLQWRPSSKLEFYFDGNYNQYQDKEIKYSIFSGAVAPNAPVSNIRSLVVDSNQNATSVVFTGRKPATAAQTTVRDSTTYSFALGGKWKVGNLIVDGEADRSYGSSPTFQTIIRAVTADANGIVDIETHDNLLSVSYDDMIAGAQNFTVEEYNNNDVNVKSDEQAARLDFDWKLNRGILSVIEFGARVTGQNFDRDRERYLTTGGINPLRGKPVLSVPALQGLYFDAPEQDYFSSYSQLSFPRTWFTFNPYTTLNGSPQPYAALFGAPENPPHVPDEEYTLDEGTEAAYLKFNFDGKVIGLDVRGNAGVRYVRTHIRSHTDVQDAVGVLTPLNQAKDYDNWLPSANLAVEVAPGLLTRLAYAKTVVRPSFAQLRPSVSITFTSGNGTTDPYDASGGNPLLDPFQATQYDLSVEKYFGRGNLISGALFYRDVNAFIQNLLLQNYTLPNGLVVDLSLPQNGSSAKVKGAEFGIQYGFDFLPGWLNGFGIYANYTYSNSRTPNKDRFGKYLQLEGLSRDTYNVSGYYEKYGFSARLSYNWRSKRLLVTQGQAGRPEYQTPDEQLDMSLGWDVNPQFHVSFDARNLTHRLGRQYNETFDAATQLFYEDTKYTLGFRAKF